MTVNRWIRTEVNGKTGHAGRKGFIVPAAPKSGGKFIAWLYDMTENTIGGTVGELKKFLDATE